MAVIPYRTARAQTANYLELGKRVAPEIKRENDRAKPFLRAQTIVERGTYGDPGEANPPLSMRQQRERDHGGPPVQPIGPRPWVSKPTCSGAEQLDLAGRPVPLLTPSAPAAPTVRGQQLGLEVTVPRSYHSPAWGGTVTEQPLTLDASPDQAPDDHGRPAYLGPIGTHFCPGVATCPHRWLLDDELEEV